MSAFTQVTKIRFTRATGYTALAGAIGGYLAYILAVSVLMPHLDAILAPTNGLNLLLGQAFISMCIGLGISVFILAVDNQQSLRGRWYRDLWHGVQLFAVVAFAGGIIGQLLYGVIQSSRAVPWLLDGAGIGSCIGVLRGDPTQIRRGALGGAIGGLLGGVGADLILSAYQSNGAFALGCAVMGAMIGLLLRLVQDAMSEAWLVGITEGPYQHKSYPLNPPQVTVGRSELNNISLYRSSELQVQSGAFVFGDGQWVWRGEPVPINGTPQTQAALNSGDDIRLGASSFRFETRAASGAVSHVASPPPTLPTAAPAWHSPGSPARPAAMAPAPVAPAVPSPVAAPPPVLQPVVVLPPATPLQPRAAVPPPTAPPPAAPPVVAPEAADSAFVLASAGAPLRVPRAACRLTIGRAESNDFVVPDDAVSSRHAVLEFDGRTLQVTDLNSTNGTSINGWLIPPGKAIALQPRDEVAIGEQRYTVYCFVTDSG